LLGTHPDPQKIQIHCPLTNTHNKILQNTYISELDLDKISDHVDLEMAINLGQDLNGFLNLNCHYDFKPTNFNYLVLSRLNFAL
jgi:hypothetical protein